MALYLCTAKCWKLSDFYGDKTKTKISTPSLASPKSSIMSPYWVSFVVHFSSGVPMTQIKYNNKLIWNQTQADGTDDWPPSSWIVQTWGFGPLFHWEPLHFSSTQVIASEINGVCVGLECDGIMVASVKSSSNDDLLNVKEQVSLAKDYNRRQQ